MWITLILNNIRTIGIIAAILAVFGAGWGIRGMKADLDIAASLKVQQVELTAICESNKKLSNEIGEKYELQISTLNSRIARHNRLQSTKCVSPTNTTSKPDGSTTTGLPDANGVAVRDLVDLAGEAEKQRQQLISLQDFVRKVWSH